MTVRTVASAAPEQLKGGDIDGHADQYALAATAYHLLTGSQLFPNSNPGFRGGLSRHRTSPFSGPCTLRFAQGGLSRWHECFEDLQSVTAKPAPTWRIWAGLQRTNPWEGSTPKPFRLRFPGVGSSVLNG